MGNMFRPVVDFLWKKFEDRLIHVTWIGVTGFGGTILHYVTDMPWYYLVLCIFFLGLTAFGLTLALWPYYSAEGRRLFRNAASEKLQFQQAVVILQADVDISELKPANPFIRFIFTMFNGSVYPVFVKSVSGHARFNDEQLVGTVEIVSGDQNVDHGSIYRFSLQQSINPQAGKHILRAIQNGERIEFRFDLLILEIGSRNPKAADYGRCLDLPALSRCPSGWLLRR